MIPFPSCPKCRAAGLVLETGRAREWLACVNCGARTEGDVAMRAQARAAARAYEERSGRKAPRAPSPKAGPLAQAFAFEFTTRGEPPHNPRSKRK